MDTANSLELDDAIFPQPPQEVSTVSNVLYGATIIADPIISKEKYRDEDEIDSLPEILKDERPKEELNKKSNKDLDEDSSSLIKQTYKKHRQRKRKSRIRRILDGIGIKRKETDSSSEDDTESTNEDSTETIKLNDESTCNEDEAATVNTSGLTRIIQRVQSKANRVWETIGQKLGSGRVDNEIEETTDESSREPSMSLSELKKTSSFFKHRDSNTKGDLVEKEKNVSFINEGDNIEGSTPLDEARPQTAGSKSNTLKKLASGLKNGLLTKKK